MASPRFHAIDGLRGYLALGVVFHHIGLNYVWYRTGVWGAGVSRFGVFLGDGSVAFFFMITAFLFWNRALDEGGRLDAYRFYVSRVRRLVPMYVVASGLAVLTALAIIGFRLNVSLLQLTRECLAWILFTAPGAPNINGFTDTLYINTVFWSLVWEWKFYLALPLLALFATPRYCWYAVAAAAACIAMFSATHFEWFFLVGCSIAMLARFDGVRRLARAPTAAIIAIALVAAAIAFLPKVYSFAGACLLAIPFLIFAGGNLPVRSLPRTPQLQHVFATQLGIVCAFPIGDASDQHRGVAAARILDIGSRRSTLDNRTRHLDLPPSRKSISHVITRRPTTTQNARLRAGTGAICRAPDRHRIAYASAVVSCRDARVRVA